jgi:hypothetical protein
VTEYFDDAEAARRDGAKGQQAVAQSRGAVDRLVEMVLPLLSLPGAASAASPES